MQKNTKLAIGVLVVFIVLIGAYYYSVQQPAVVNDTATTTAPAANPAPAQPVAASNTYTNPELGFSFAMPSNWKVLDTGISQDNGATYADFGLIDLPATDAPGGSGRVSVEANSANKTLADLKKEDEAVSYYSDFKDTFIGDEPAYTYETAEFGNALGVTVHDGKIYTLSGDMIRRADILSSFKFLN